MRLLRIATTFITTASTPIPLLASRPTNTSYLFCHPHHRRTLVVSSFLPLALLLLGNPRGGSSFVAAAAEQRCDNQERASESNIVSTAEEDGECNATIMTDSSSSLPPPSELYDSDYPGTSVQRLRSVHTRVATLATNGSLINQPWETVRRHLLWAGGLRDLPDASPGFGYTGHSFNDYNHVDLTTMNDDVSNNLNDGSVKGIAIGNRLGPGVRIASMPELGPGGSWSTCAIGCGSNPPQDVAHVQFHSRIAFKLVWVPNVNYDSFVLVDDGGTLLAVGRPTGTLPSRRERVMNYKIMEGSKYAVEADKLAMLSENTTLMS